MLAASNRETSTARRPSSSLSRVSLHLSVLLYPSPALSVRFSGVLRPLSSVVSAAPVACVVATGSRDSGHGSLPKTQAACSAFLRVPARTYAPAERYHSLSHIVAAK
ncbi:hypothetical protein ALC53_06960 [Atta colombica]|uniref:Uncharacterized protein n=1 Tax=Atta colombica TaxID=520822 RepID=A0A195BE78_9HYME|nr:hypothetical protein ALC53_06960 [Atta colombica]